MSKSQVIQQPQPSRVFKVFGGVMEYLTHTGIQLAGNDDPYFKAFMYAIRAAIQATQNGKHSFKFDLGKAVRSASQIPISEERKKLLETLKEFLELYCKDLSSYGTPIEQQCWKTLTLLLFKYEKHEMVNYESHLNEIANFYQEQQTMSQHGTMFPA